MSSGKLNLDGKDYEAAFNGISRCQEIIAELMNSLAPEHAPKLCQQLSGLYAFMMTRLMTASTERDPVIVQEVITLLEYERQTWLLLLAKLADEKAAAGSITDATDQPAQTGGTVSFSG